MSTTNTSGNTCSYDSSCSGACILSKCGGSCAAYNTGGCGGYNACSVGCYVECGTASCINYCHGLATS